MKASMIPIHLPANECAISLTLSVNFLSASPIPNCLQHIVNIPEHSGEKIKCIILVKEKKN